MNKFEAEFHAIVLLSQHRASGFSENSGSLGGVSRNGLVGRLAWIAKCDSEGGEIGQIDPELFPFRVHWQHAVEQERKVMRLAKGDFMLRKQRLEILLGALLGVKADTVEIG